ncbi:MAG: serine O-acetyltransferase [Clostridia bacterium]|nr:serine O-acetyltransferase [Clostridia bacterium]
MKKQCVLGAVAIASQVVRVQKGVTRCLAAVKREFAETVQAVRERDPAARNTAEILLLYSGVHAIMAHRLAHRLHQKQHYFAARAISQTARHFTGIEIHPGATIGKNFFIDHGSGVVIGETTEIGDNCTIYQGVTLGGTGKDVGKRHPTLGDNVMVGSGAKVLGPLKVGSGSKIAANAVVLHPVPENSTAVGIPAKVVRRDGVRVTDDLDQIHIPDPVAQQLARMEGIIVQLQQKVESLEKEKADAAENG